MEEWKKKEVRVWQVVLLINQNLILKTLKPSTLERWARRYRADRIKKWKQREEEDEGDSPVECSSGEAKQLAFISGEVSGPIPSRDWQEQKVIFLHQERSTRRGGGVARAQKASTAGERWRQQAEDSVIVTAPLCARCLLYLLVGVA